MQHLFPYLLEKYLAEPEVDPRGHAETFAEWAQAELGRLGIVFVGTAPGTYLRLGNGDEVALTAMPQVGSGEYSVPITQTGGQVLPSSGAVPLGKTLGK